MNGNDFANILELFLPEIVPKKAAVLREAEGITLTNGLPLANPITPPANAPAAPKKCKLKRSDVTFTVSTSENSKKD